MVLDGTPMMSPNCWQAIHEAAEARGPCRYLEWGTGNSTLAMLRTALESWSARLGDPRRGERSRIRRRDDGRDRRDLPPRRRRRPRAASSHCDTRSPVCCKRSVPIPSYSLYESQFLKVLWRTRNDDYWMMDARPWVATPADSVGYTAPNTQLRCSTGHTLHRVRCAVGAEDVKPSHVSAGTVQAPAVATRAPRRGHRLRNLEREARRRHRAAPQLRNRIWHRSPILDGLYTEFADYVSAPLDGRFDVVLVDGRARTSCLKRVHHDKLLNARRGAVPARRPPPVAPGSAAALQSRGRTCAACTKER